MHLGLTAGAAHGHAVAIGRRFAVRVAGIVILGFSAADGALPAFSFALAFCTFHRIESLVKD